MKKLFPVLVFAAFSHGVGAQDVMGSAQIGVATYSMTSFKAFSDQSFSALLPGLKTTCTDNFPSYLYYQGDITLNYERSLYGITMGHGSTGSRYYYGDYSGSFSRDNLLRYNYVGLRIGEKLFTRKNFFLALNFRLTYIRNALEIKETLTIGNLTDQQSIDLRSTNVGIQPFFQFQQNFSKFHVKAEMGYEYQIPFRIHLKGNPDAVLVNSNNGNVELSGNGFRCTIGIGYTFKSL